MSIKNKQKIKKVIKKKVNKKKIINKKPSTKGGSSTEKMKNKLKDLVDEQKLIEKKLIEQKNKKSSDKSSIKKLKDRLDELINELKLLRKEVHNPENYQTVGVVKQIEDDGKPHRHRRSYSVERTPSNRRPSPPKRGGNIDNLHKIDSTYEPTEECTKLLKQYEIDPIERTAEGIYNLTIGGRKKYKRKNKKGGNYIDQYLNRLN